MNNNYYFETVIFFYLIHEKLIGSFAKKYFTETTIVQIFDFVQDFVREYNTAPTADQIIEIVRIHGKDEIILPQSIRELWERENDYKTKYSKEWLQSSCEKWGKYRSFYTSLETTIAYVQTWPQTMSYEESGKYIAKANDIFNRGASFTLDPATGHDFFDFQTHQIDPQATHKTGYPFLDQALCGGFAEKCLYVFMGAPKSGKSMWLCSLAANSVRNGYNTVYITLELAYQKVSRRLGANMFNIPMDQYAGAMADPTYFQKASQAFFNNGSSLISPGKFIIEEFPTSTMTASDMEAFLLRVEEQNKLIYGEDWKIDNVFIDYINIMRDQKGSAAGDTYNKIKNICEDTRAVGQKHNWAIISATQTNRAGMDASDLKITDVSESSGLLATVDGLIGIIHNDAMRIDHVYYLKALAMRDSIHQDERKKYIMDANTLRITEDPSENVLQPDQKFDEKYLSIEERELDKYKRTIQKQHVLKTSDLQQTTNNTQQKPANLNKTEKKALEVPLFTTEENLFN